MKLSSTRQEVLNIVKESLRPLSARDVKLSLTNGGINLSTVYRALEYLEKTYLICSIPLGNARYYYSSEKDGHGHFLVCRECREIINFDECAVEFLQEKLQKKYKYDITGHAIFFEGMCHDCRNWENRKFKNGGMKKNVKR